MTCKTKVITTPTSEKDAPYCVLSVSLYQKLRLNYTPWQMYAHRTTGTIFSPSQ